MMLGLRSAAAAALAVSSLWMGVADEEPRPPYGDIVLTKNEAFLDLRADAQLVWDLFTGVLRGPGGEDLALPSAPPTDAWLLAAGIWVRTERLPYKAGTWTRVRLRVGSFESAEARALAESLLVDLANALEAWLERQRSVDGDVARDRRAPPAEAHSVASTEAVAQEPIVEYVYVPYAYPAYHWIWPVTAYVQYVPYYGFGFGYGWGYRYGCGFYGGRGYGHPYGYGSYAYGSYGWGPWGYGHHHLGCGCSVCSPTIIVIDGDDDDGDSGDRGGRGDGGNVADDDRRRDDDDRGLPGPIRAPVTPNLASRDDVTRTRAGGRGDVSPRQPTPGGGTRGGLARGGGDDAGDDDAGRHGGDAGTAVRVSTSGTTRVRTVTASRHAVRPSVGRTVVSTTSSRSAPSVRGSLPAITLSTRNTGGPRTSVSISRGVSTSGPSTSTVTSSRSSATTSVPSPTTTTSRPTTTTTSRPSVWTSRPTYGISRPSVSSRTSVGVSRPSVGTSIGSRTTIGTGTSSPTLGTTRPSIGSTRPTIGSRPSSLGTRPRIGTTRPSVGASRGSTATSIRGRTSTRGRVSTPSTRGRTTPSRGRGRP